MSDIQKTRTIIFVLLVIGALIIAIIGVGIPAKNEGGGFTIPSFFENYDYTAPKMLNQVSQRDRGLYSWRTNPPPNYPQNTFNTPYDETMRMCTNNCGQMPNPGLCQNKCSHLALFNAGIGKFTVALGDDSLTRERSRVPVEKTFDREVHLNYVFQPDDIYSAENTFHDPNDKLVDNELAQESKSKVENFSSINTSNPSHSLLIGVNDRSRCFNW